MAKLRLAVVGLNMGRNHCRVFQASDSFELVAVCDIDPARIAWVQEHVCPCKGYAHYEDMLREERPEVVVVSTPNNLHSSMTILAALYGAKGVYCEKPMAPSLIEAQTMLKVCNKLGVKLMIGHQRRYTPVYQKMKQLMDDGAIGDITLIRGTAAGDFLSDGTHTVDSVRFFLGDQMPDWVLTSLYRDPIGSPIWNGHFTGRRYGHSVESGMQVSMEFPGRVRAEILTGGMWFPKRTYQDFEIFGTAGRLWRAGDDADPELLIQDRQGGGFRPVAVERPPMEEITLDGGGHGANLTERVLVADAFARMINEGVPHPMGGDNAILSHEVVMACYESARIHDRVRFPLTQDSFPLDLMLQDGQIV
jgi:UDP-N-acetyl-2-amino-2-deoxyglucuronate dehydrogenase